MKRLVAIVVVMVLAVSFISGCGAGSGTKPAQPAQPAQSAQPSTSQQPGQITLRLGHAAQTSHPFHIATQKFVELVAQKSNGKIKIEVFPARQLGDDGELLEQVMKGTLDMGVISSSTFSKYTPLLDTLQLPFLLSTYDKEYKAITSNEAKELLKGLESLKIKGLAIYEGGIRHFANNVRPITKPEDLKGLKLRVVPSNLIRNSVQALGANPNPMAYGEVYSALQTKVIDGEEINLTSIYSEKHYEVLKYVTLIGLWPFPAANVMNLDKFNSLSKEDQKILEDSAWESIEYAIKELTNLEKTATKAIQDNKVQVNEVKDLAPFQAKVTSIWDEYAAKDPAIKKFVDMAKTLK
ncbi:MAG TPA: TRAP transporter substrate-binding protein [Firmicutes bacterium]|nr:TRAP transporter substrate-binding protein [Bacillota bacterium]